METLRRKLALPCLLLFMCAPAWGAQTVSRPKIRAITAFIRIDAAHYDTQVREALTMLRDARNSYLQRGYEVETIRITTQPFPEIVHGLSDEQAMDFFQGFDALAKRESFLANIGPAMLSDSDPIGTADLLTRVLTQTETLNSSIVVAQEDGIHWNAVRESAKVVKYVAEHSPHSRGTFRFAATAMLAPFGPFFPGSYHTSAGHAFSIGLEAADVVRAVFESSQGNVENAAQSLAAELSRFDTECEQIAKQIEKQSGWTYAGLDPTPAPLGKVSIGDAIEKFIGAKFGSSGTMTAAAIITRAVKSVPVKQVGYAGLMLPVMEDSLLAQRWSESTYSIDSLLAYSAVCATGLDTVPLPGDITEQQLAKIIGDMASLAFKWKKPLSARLQPVTGKKAGEKTDFGDPVLTDAVLQKLP
jgi:uncharacterized protein